MLHVLDFPVNKRRLENLELDWKKKFGERVNYSNDLTPFQRAITVVTIILVLFSFVLLILIIGDPSGLSNVSPDIDNGDNSNESSGVPYVTNS